jgi:hypothetical protein
MQPEITASLAASLLPLAPLLGVWRGNGQGVFPTIEPFAYEEEVRFAARDGRAALWYEQATWKIAPDGTRGAPSHWETGFLRLIGDGQIEIVSAQSSGRVEVLRGTLARDPLHIAVVSVVQGNDDRMRATARRITLDGATLRYEMDMATTRVPELQGHVVTLLTLST